MPYTTGSTTGLSLQHSDLRIQTHDVLALLDVQVVTWTQLLQRGAAAGLWPPDSLHLAAAACVRQLYLISSAVLSTMGGLPRPTTASCMHGCVYCHLQYAICVECATRAMNSEFARCTKI